MISTVDPATGKPLASYAYTSDAELTRQLRQADETAKGSAAQPITDRVARIRRLAEQLRSRRDELAVLITAEMGKPVTQARAELDKCAATCDYYADRLPELLAPQPVDVAPDTAEIRLRPLGVLLAIMPWNYPFWQVIRAMLPAVAVGNTVLLKHADNVTACATAVQELFDAACGPGVLTRVLLPAERIGPLIDDPAILGVAFTGSNRVGALVAARAGQAVKKTVLELGGSDPFVVLDDADVPAAAAAAVRSRYLNTGQSCIAAKRIIVVRPVFDEFCAAVVAELGALNYGEPAEPDTDVGPMARTDLRDELQRQLWESVYGGARVLFGGTIDERPGAWFPPTLVQVPDPASVCFQEETFGPLGAVLAVESDSAATDSANATSYGLSCSIWGGDPVRIDRVAERVTAGSIFVNRISESDPRLPVGGVAASGHGRELGACGITEFANIQAVRTATTSRSTR